MTEPGPAGPAQPSMPNVDLLDHLPDVAWCVDSQGRCSWVSARWTAVTGCSAAASHDLGWLQAVRQEDRPGFLSTLLASPAAGAPGKDIRLHSVGCCRARWYRARVCALPTARAPAPLHLVLAADVDDLHHPDTMQAQTVFALQHRMRSTFGVIRAIMRRTARFSITKDDFVNSFDSRVGALARAQARVIRTPVAGVGLAQLVADELAACATHEGSAVHIHGPAVRLRARAAEAFALAVHELAMNALRHGALSARHGRIDITWYIRAGQELEFTWREAGLPINQAGATFTGYGREVLEQSLPYELKAETHFTLGNEGLVVRIRLPLPGNVPEPTGPGPAPPTPA